MAGKREIGELFNNLQKSLKRFTVTELNSKIDTLLKDAIHPRQIEIDNIITIVCDEYKISKSRLKQKNSRGEIQEAKEISYCLLHNELELPIRYISEHIFSLRGHRSIQSGIERLREADYNHPQDRLFIDKYTKLKEKYIGFKNIK